MDNVNPNNWTGEFTIRNKVMTAKAYFRSSEEDGQFDVIDLIHEGRIIVRAIQHDNKWCAYHFDGFISQCHKDPNVALLRVADQLV